MKQVVPVGPAASANRLVGLGTGLNAHVGNPALRLPFGEVALDQMHYSTLTLKVFGRNGTKFVVIPLAFKLGAHPLDGIKPFLKYVIWAWLEVKLPPLS